MFKNVTLYKIDLASMPSLMEVLLPSLQRVEFTPCGDLEMTSSGFVPPVKHGDLVHKVDKQILMRVQTEKRLLPSSVVNEQLAKVIEQFEIDNGYAVGRKLKRELKDDVIVQLLPQSFTTKTHTDVWLDTKNGWLVINTASTSKSDLVIRLLLKAIPDIAIEMVRINNSPTSAMTDWLAGGENPYNFTIDNNGELKSHLGATIKYVKHSLAEKSVQEHISSGKQCSKLALTWNDKISFVLTDSFLIKKIELLKVLQEKLGDLQEEQFDGEFLMETVELNLLFADLIDALGGEVLPEKTGELQ